MKTTLKIGILALALGLSQSCQQHNDTDPKGKEGAPAHHHEADQQPKDHASAEVGELRLNDGERWGANPETTAGIANMVMLVEQFSKDQDAAAYRSLKEDLQEEFNKIVQQCTMKGEAHEQLHHYIYPLKEMIDDLDAEERHTREETYEELEQHLGLYPVYFK